MLDDLTKPVPEIRCMVAAGELDWSEDLIREYAVARAACPKGKWQKPQDPEPL